jgi:hypothetical protein
MSLLSDNVIPGNHGKVFGTDAKNKRDLDKIRKNILTVDGVKDVILNYEVYPKEFTIHTTKLVSIEAIQKVVTSLGFHLVPKDAIEL